MTPTAIDNGSGSRVVRKYRPIGPPIIRPTIKNFKGFQFTFDFSLKKTLKANGKPSSDNNWGTKEGLIWIMIGDAITAKPKPRTPWTAADIKTRNATNINSCRDRSKGMFN